MSQHFIIALLVVSSIDQWKNIMITNDSPYELSTDVSVNSLYDLTLKDSRKSLYVAVILQALLDLTKPKLKKEDSAIQLYRDQAHVWFFKEVGVTCQDFEDVCCYAGVEPNTIRKFASNVINSEDLTDVRRRFHTLL